MGQICFEEFKEKYVDPNPKRVLIFLIIILISAGLIICLIGGTFIGAIIVIIDIVNPKVQYQGLSLADATFQSIDLMSTSIDFTYPVIVTNHGYFDIHVTSLVLEVYREGRGFGTVVNTYDVWLPPYTPKNFTLAVALSASFSDVTLLPALVSEYGSTGYISFDFDGDVIGDYLGVWFTRPMAQGEYIDL